LLRVQDDLKINGDPTAEFVQCDLRPVNLHTVQSDVCLMVSMEEIQLGDLFKTRVTPHGPEIQNYDFPWRTMSEISSPSVVVARKSGAIESWKDLPATLEEQAANSSIANSIAIHAIALSILFIQFLSVTIF